MSLSTNIGSWIQLPNQHLDSEELFKKKNTAMKKFKYGYGDHFALLKIYELALKAKRQNNLQKWCKDNFVNYKIIEDCIDEIEGNLLQYANDKPKLSLMTEGKKLVFDNNMIDDKWTVDKPKKIEDRILICLLAYLKVDLKLRELINIIII